MEKNTVTAQNIIDQDGLRALEALCTQEQPPACTAACPLHMDGREFSRLVGEGSFAAAFKLYQKTVPFAGVVARCCNAPCKLHCRRGKLGGAVEMQLLERFVAEKTGHPAKPPMMISKKSQRAAICGGGLRGMTAAWELAKKGYQVTLFEKEQALGGVLRALPEEVLPHPVLEAEIKALLALKVRVEYGVTVPLEDAQTAADFLLQSADAAFVACESPLDDKADGESLLVAGQEVLLAGRRAGRMTGGHSSVYDTYDGRSAAATLDRLFQKVNLMTGREKEGSAETQLFTNLAGFEAAPPVVPGPGGYTEGQAAAEAGRCVQCACLECVKKCGFMQYYNNYPKKLVREVYNNLSIAMGNHHANGMIDSCALCGQCEAICPNGLDMRQVFTAARQRMVDTEKMPASAFEFAMEDMAASLSEEFYLLRHQPGHDTSQRIFFPGCQLGASEPGLVAAVYADLCQRTEDGTGLWLGCCGVMAHWAGEAERFEAAKQKLRADWQGMGSPQVVAGCPTCAATLSELCGIEAITLFDLLGEMGLAENPAEGEAAGSSAEAYVLHHACGARHAPEVRESARALCGAVGARLLDAPVAEEQNPCCGYGGLAPFSNPETASAITDTALAQLSGGEEPPLLTYCVNCRDRYLAKGRPAWHILELAYPGAQNTRHAPPTWSERRKNRINLKNRLLHEVWQQPTEEKPAMQLFIDRELEDKIQETHILHGDIEAAIAHAEAGGDKLAEPKTGHLIACHRPRNVTFWVEYAPEGAGFRVFNAWCHRMQAIVTDKLTESGAAER